MLDQTNAQATIDQSIRLPDYFSCQNCIAWRGKHLHWPGHPLADPHGLVDLCRLMRDENACAKQMLGQALATGAIQIHLYLMPSQPGPSQPALSQPALSQPALSQPALSQPMEVQL